MRTLAVIDAWLAHLNVGTWLTFASAPTNHFHDDEIEHLARVGQRIVLTRDRELLKRRAISHGCYVRALRSEAQLREVFDRLDLARSARPFTRCLRCNTELQPVDKACVQAQVPERVRAHHERFSTCPGCRRIFWEGTHWRRMRELVDSLPVARA